MRMKRDRSPQTRSTPYWLLMACLLFLGIGAIGGGGQFLLDPTGGIIGMPVDVLAGSPFTDFLLPGLILFTVLGLFPLVVLYGLYTRRSWAWPAVIMVGIALIIWIVVQGLIVGFGHWLQWLYLCLGFVLILLALLPSVRRTVRIDFL
jgi:hypothetical protein